MSDVIERLLDVEHEARRLIARAEREAQQTLERAREEGRRIVSEGHEEAQRRAQETVDHTERTLRRRAAERLEDERKRLPSAERVDPARLAEAVEFAVSAVARGSAPRRWTS